MCLKHILLLLCVIGFLENTSTVGEGKMSDIGDGGSTSSISIVILEDSYNDCLQWLSKSIDGTITIDEFWLYIGETEEDFKFIRDYLNKNPAAHKKQDVIDIELYGELIKQLCSLNNCTVKAFAESRKEFHLLIVQDSYGDCLQWLGKSLDSTITTDEFWLYIGKSKGKFLSIRDYLNKNPAANEKQDAINLDLYGELFKKLCSLNNCTVKVFAESRKEFQILKDSYEHFLRWLGKSLYSTITMEEFWSYIGKTPKQFKLIRDYLEKNPAANQKQDAVDLKLYGELFRKLCSLNNCTVKAFAKSRKEFQILKDSYNDCRKWLGKSLDCTITMDEFWSYIGKTPKKFKFIRAYLDKNPAAHKKQDAIELELYVELFTKLCISCGYTVENFAASSKNEAAVRAIRSLTL